MLENEKEQSYDQDATTFLHGFYYAREEEKGSTGKKKIVCDFVQMCRNSTSFCGFPRQLLA